MRRQHAADFAAHPFLDPRQRGLPLGSFRFNGADHFGAGSHPLLALGEAGDRRVLVVDLGGFGQLEGFGWRRRNFGKARAQHRADGGHRGAAHGLALQRARIDGGLKGEASQAADEVALHGYVAFWRQVSHERIFFPQACEQGSGPPVHETGRQGNV